ncbi:MAG: hypothetical protein ACLQUY_16125 [Ktedonobacterales bacterium]
MSGPDGSMTKRDARRNARRAQFETQQAERRRERERKIRRQRLQTYAIIGGSIVLFLLIGFLVIHAVVGSHGASVSPHHGSYTSPVDGSTRLLISSPNQVIGQTQIFEYHGVSIKVTA